LRRLSEAEILLQSLGVEAAEDIDLNAIACHLGVIAIRERRLDGCEARVIGRGRNAIISVSASSIPQRQRFSICHELGHWRLHRGEILYCKSADIGDRDVAQVKEKEANRFAADLMLPPYLVEHMAAGYRDATIKAVDEIRARFKASRSATAIQLIKLHPKPTLISFQTRAGRRWQIPGPGVPRSLAVRPDIGHESWAFGMLHGTALDQPQPRQIRADVWFDRRGIERFRVTEQSFVAGDGIVATLIGFPDLKILESYADKW
jgi:hypothetical protein